MNSSPNNTLTAALEQARAAAQRASETAEGAQADVRALSNEIANLADATGQREQLAEAVWLRDQYAAVRDAADALADQRWNLVEALRERLAQTE